MKAYMNFHKKLTCFFDMQIQKLKPINEIGPIISSFQRIMLKFSDICAEMCVKKCFSFKLLLKKYIEE